MSNEQDRRVYPRSEVRIRVFLLLGEEEEVVLYTRDFSNGGAFIECPPLVIQALQADMPVQLSWYQNRRSADGYEVVPAHVVRVASSGIAVHFDHDVANLFAA